MAGIMSRAVTRAMTVQLERVNSSPGALQQSLRERDQLIRVLQDDLAAARAEIARLRERLAALEFQEFQSEVGIKPRLIHRGRPVLTPAEAARHVGVSLATVSRYVKSGWWEADQLSSSRWLIYADRPLIRKSRR